MKQIAGPIRVELAQYRSLAAFAQFGSDLDTATQNALAQGERITEVLKQAQYAPMSVAEQVVVLFAATRKYLLDVPLKAVRPFEKELLEFVNTKYPEILTAVVVTKGITGEDEDQLTKIVSEFKKGFKALLNF